MHYTALSKSLGLLKEISSVFPAYRGTVRVSNAGAPHLVIDQFSVVRFTSTKEFRVFYPYGAPRQQQTVKDCEHKGEVIAFLKEALQWRR